MGEGELNWVKKMEQQANLSAALDSDAKKKNTVVASEKIVDHMAHEYEWSKAVVDSLNAAVNKKITSYDFVANEVDYHRQLYLVAAGVFEDFVANSQRIYNADRDDKKHRVYDRWLKEYEEQLREKLNIEGNV